MDDYLSKNVLAYHYDLTIFSWIIVAVCIIVGIALLIKGKFHLKCVHTFAGVIALVCGIAFIILCKVESPITNSCNDFVKVSYKTIEYRVEITDDDIAQKLCEKTEVIDIGSDVYIIRTNRKMIRYDQLVEYANEQ